jgi:hypothetical protein
MEGDAAEVRSLACVEHALPLEELVPSLGTSVDEEGVKADRKIEDSF